jgi:hypothetical protein
VLPLVGPPKFMRLVGCAGGIITTTMHFYYARIELLSLAFIDNDRIGIEIE